MRILILVPALLLAACGPPPGNMAEATETNLTDVPEPVSAAPALTAPVPGAAAASTRYRCMDGNKLAMTFDNQRDTVTLRRGGERLGILSKQPAASGIWYKRGGLELRGKGDAATFTEPGKPPIACTTIR